MEQQENKVNNPDNEVNASVENIIKPLDRLRDVMLSRLRQLQMVKLQQEVVYDSITVSNSSTSDKVLTESSEQQQIAVNESVPVMDIPNALLEDTKTDQEELQGQDSTNTMTICDFPNEVMYKILKNLSFDAIAVNRIVCRYFNVVCSDILNSEFKCLRNLIQQRLQTLKSQMPRRESARRQHPLAREFDIIETVNMRLSLMQTMFSKHCPFFAGQVLDEVRRILDYLKTTPLINFAYKVTDELFDLSTMAVEYFKERIEPSLPDTNYIGGFNDLYLFDSGSSSSGSVHGLDAPLCSKSFDGIPELDSHEHDYSLPVLQKANDIFTQSYKFTTNTQEETTTSRVPNIFSRSTTRRIKMLELRNKRANRKIKSLQFGLKICKRKLATNQKRIRQYRSHFEDYDKKLDLTCVKLNTVMEELTKCKTEIQYLRSINPPSQSQTSTTLLLTPESASIVTSNLEGKKSKAIKRKLDFVHSEVQYTEK